MIIVNIIKKIKKFSKLFNYQIDKNKENKNDININREILQSLYFAFIIY